MCPTIGLAESRRAISTRITPIRSQTYGHASSSHSGSTTARTWTSRSSSEPKGAKMAKTESQPTGDPGRQAEIHMTLQGKGGVGKSLVASVLAQYFGEQGRVVRCVDTDPVNRTLAQYSALGAGN